jgi:hypothetical protein
MDTLSSQKNRHTKHCELKGFLGAVVSRRAICDSVPMQSERQLQQEQTEQATYRHQPSTIGPNLDIYFFPHHISGAPETSIPTS